MKNIEKIAEVARIGQRIAQMSKGGNSELADAALTLLDSLTHQIEGWAADELEADRIARAS